MMICAALLLFGYFCGSIPFGLLLTRAAGLGDIRGIGSGNIGATNVLRTGNKALAAVTLLLDGAKGAIPVLIAARFGEAAMLATGLAALLGHLFPIWLQFKGGKGVATGLGVLLGTFLPVGLVACATWLSMARASRYSSLSALTAFAIAPLAALLFGRWHLAILAAVIAVLVFWTHRGNIARLRAGTEPRIGRKA
jgi:glycerol-3-phosphate acyltransferase PlsY